MGPWILPVSVLFDGLEVVNGRLACGVVRYVGIVPEASPGVWAGIRHGDFLRAGTQDL